MKVFQSYRFTELLCAIVLVFHLNYDGTQTASVDAFVMLPTPRSPASPPKRLQASPTAMSPMKEDNAEHSLIVLNQAVGDTRQSIEAADLIGALRTLETLQRQRAKQDDSLSEDLRRNLVGDWQLMLVTDKRLQSVIYLPVRNIFSIRKRGSDDEDDDNEPFQVENAIRLGNWVLLSFLGSMEYNVRKRQGLFDYNRFTLFNGAIDIGLKPGEAERMVSSVEKRATPKTKKPLFGAYSNEKPASTKPFFNFFVANENVAAARGSVGGFALWKRVQSC